MSMIKPIPVIESVEVNPSYDMTLRTAQEIKAYSEGSALDGIYNGFKFGYAQGLKAAGKALQEEKE